MVAALTQVVMKVAQQVLTLEADQAEHTVMQKLVALE
jgi:hypothetical protein|tara:strand:- start:945 stop:1055 length:111 start_codon:yes stop_codon:yes gene_type:complete